MQDLAMRLKEADKLITRRRLDEARTLCTETCLQYPDNLDARKQLYLVLHMVGEFELADLLLSGTRKLLVDPIDLGDFLRDAALAYIRRRDLVQASKLVGEVIAMHYGDANRLGCLEGVRARIEAASGRFDLALTAHREAHCKITNPQWRFNNRVHWQRSAWRGKRFGIALWQGFCILLGTRRYGTWKHVGGVFTPWARWQ